MADSKKKRLSFITCPACSAKSELITGPKRKKGCRNCGSVGMAIWLGDRLLTFDREFSEAEFLRRQASTWLARILNSFLVAFGIIGILFLGRVVFSMIELKLSPETVWALPSVPFLIFWISVLTDLYLIFRLERRRALKLDVARKSYAKKLVKVRVPRSWEDVHALPQKYTEDISSAFTDHAARATENAWKLARKFKHPHVMPIHLLASLLNVPTIDVAFGRLGLSPQALHERINGMLYRITSETKTKRKRTGRSTGVSPEFARVLFYAYLEAYETRQARVHPLQLLVALSYRKNEAWEVLYDMEIDLDKLRNLVAWLNMSDMLLKRRRRFRKLAGFRAKGEMNRAMTAVTTPFLDRFSVDVTRLASAGKLTPAIARDSEIDSVLRSLESGRHGIVLIGYPGVGKRAIIHGIAQRMVAEDVPEILFDKRLVSLDIPRLVAGASASGELEKRLAMIVREISRAGNVMLFIENLHDMVGIKTARGEAFDLTDLLVSAMSRTRLMVLGSTTPMDYKAHIEPNGVLANAFDKVEIPEMDINQAIQVMESKAPHIEYQNKVYFSYGAFEAAARLTDRYMHDRYLPEKAVDIIEEAAVAVRQKRGKDAIIADEDIAALITGRTGIPIEMTESEKEKLLQLEDLIHKRIIGQDEAVKHVSDALRRARTELRDTKRPIASLLFMGSTGVGKTELAKSVAAIYFGSEKKMIRVDMSEYQEQASIRNLIGAPGGRVGGYLTEQVRKNPFAVLLLDEIEKAHPDILNLFLQVMEDGRMTDATGRVVDFNNVILIATSNAGTAYIQDQTEAGVSIENIKEALINRELRSFFRPEFLNRFDGIIVFKPLTFVQVKQIAKLMIAKERKRLESKGIALEVTPEALEELSKKGFDPDFGARPLRRVIQENVSNALATYLLRGKIGRRDKAILEKGMQIRVEKAKRL